MAPFSLAIAIDGKRVCKTGKRISWIEKKNMVYCVKARVIRQEIRDYGKKEK
jgi:hypothetical protein